MHRRFFQDSLSEKLSRLSLPANLAVVRVAHVHAVFVTENILLPIREDRLSAQKFAFFSSMAKAFAAETEIYSIHPTSRRRLATMDTHTARMLFQRINTRLSHYVNTMRLLDIPLTIKHALTGREIDQILHHLARHDFQLMIIGGRRAFPDFLVLPGKPHGKTLLAHAGEHHRLLRQGQKVMRLFALDRQALLQRLKTSENGLSPEQVARRLTEFGPNELATAAKKNYLLAYLGQYTNFFAILLEGPPSSPLSPIIMIRGRAAMSLAMPSSGR